MEKTHADSVAQHKALHDRAKAAEARVKQLEARVNDDNSSDLVVINQRLVEELEDVKSRHQKDLEQSDFSADQTRKKYQSELAQLAEGMLRFIHYIAQLHDILPRTAVTARQHEPSTRREPQDQVRLR